MRVASEAKQIVAGAGWPRSRISTCARRSISGRMTRHPERPSGGTAIAERVGSLGGWFGCPAQALLGSDREIRIWALRAGGDQGPVRPSDGTGGRENPHRTGRGITERRDRFNGGGGVRRLTASGDGGRRLGGVSAVYPDFPAVDESEYTRSVAEHLGMPLHLYQQQAAPSIASTNGPGSPMDPCPRSRFPSTRSTTGCARSLGYRRC